MVSKSLSISQGNLLKFNQSERPKTCAPLNTTIKEKETINKRRIEASTAKLSKPVSYKSQESKVQSSLNNLNGSIQVVSEKINQSTNPLVKQRKNLLRTPLRFLSIEIPLCM